MKETLSPEITRKVEALRALIKSLDSVLIAFSGGVDSTFLAYVAHEALGAKAVAVTARSQTYPQWEFDEAVALAKQIGIRHFSIETDEFSVESFCNNPPDRCYYCKRELMSKLLKLARKEGLQHVADGANADDTDDFRPGMRAASELGVCSPLREVGFTKDEIRIASRTFGLTSWNKPSYACLASRFPYGQKITPEGLAAVDQAEQFVRSLGIRQVRVRHHGDIARIEVSPQDIPTLAAPFMREKLLTHLKQFGFTYITLDLQGYRTGSMNETLNTDDLIQSSEGKSS